MQAKSAVARVLRGGAWNNPAGNARSAYRNHDRRGNTWHNTGFRLALSSGALWRTAGVSRAAGSGTRRRVPTAAWPWGLLRQTARAPGSR